MITREEFKRRGFIIDDHASGGSYAYKGARFRPDVGVECMTEKEEALFNSLMCLVNLFGDPTQYAAFGTAIHKALELVTEVRETYDQAHDRIFP